MDCKHGQASKINTYEGFDMKITDTNYQCTVCGVILTKEKYQDILTNNCTNCNGNGQNTDGYDIYKCGCILDENHI